MSFILDIDTGGSIPQWVVSAFLERAIRSALQSLAQQCSMFAEESGLDLILLDQDEDNDRNKFYGSNDELDNDADADGVVVKENLMRLVTSLNANGP